MKRDIEQRDIEGKGKGGGRKRKEKLNRGKLYTRMSNLLFDSIKQITKNMY